jgi:hypothetical protein
VSCAESAIVSFPAAPIGWAAQYARTRDPDKLWRLIVLGLLTVVLGLLGTATGLQASVRYIHDIPAKWMFLIGLREALNNFVLALCFVSIDLLVLAFTPRRAAATRVLQPAAGKS